MTEDYSIPNTKVYCEDDYFAENYSQNYHLKCDHSLQTPEPPLPFNYSRFNEYLKLKKQVECVNRSVEASVGVTPPGLEYYTDERLQTELFDVYGDLDEKSETFHLIFQNYKEHRLEQVQEWIEREKKVLQDNKNGTSENDEGFLLDEDEFLLQHFTAEEISSFKAVATTGTSSKSVGGPFVLPKKILLLNVDHNQKNKCSSSANKRNRSNSKGYLAQRNELVALEVENVLQQHQMGLTRDKLLQICNERLGRKAPPGVIMNLNSDMIDGFLTKERILVTRPFFQEGGLIFPRPESLVPAVSSLLSCSVDPMEYLWNVRHKLLVVLNLCMGIEEVNRCIDLYNKIFKNTPCPFIDWGFDTALDLINWLFVHKWSANGVELIQLNPGGGKGKSGVKTFLAVMTDKKRKYLEKKASPQSESTKNFGDANEKADGSGSSSSISAQSSYSNVNKKKGKGSSKKVENFRVPLSSRPSDPSSPLSSPSPASSSSPWNKQAPLLQKQQQPYKPPILNYDPTVTFIESKYVQFGDKIIREENEIKPGTEFDCVVSLVNSPTSIFMVRLVRWQQLERLFSDLRDYWISNPTALCPHPQFLQRNYLCLAKTDNKQELEVYRVVVLGGPDPHQNYQVLCIDYGDLLNVRHDQLRYLPKSFLYTLDAQAITCSLYNVASPTKDAATGNDVWNKAVCNYTSKLFIPNDLPVVKVLFKQRIQGTGKWLVKASSAQRNDFGEDVMKFVNKGKS